MKLQPNRFHFSVNSALAGDGRLVYGGSIMKPLTTSVYTFSDLIQGGYQYVDKTAGIYELIREFKGQYFLSRPRRFGKSLLISTLKAIFLGRRELFEGLALADLTISRQASTLLGYTQEEVEANFPDYIERLAKSQGRSIDETLDELRVWYNGYKFHQHAPTVYNPVSLMKCFQNEEFKNYWFETGTPTFLLDLLKGNPLDLDNLEVDENAFSTYDPIDLHPLPLLVQTGYLTIKAAEMMGDVRYYTLGYPNLEISQSFSYWLVRSMACVPDPELSGALRHMVKALQAGDVDAMLEHLKTFFHNVPYDLIEAKEREKYYQTIFFTVFKLIGAMIDAEVKTSRGRIDAVIRTADHIYIFEFKLHGTAEAAMAQIHDKKYAAPYRDDPRRKILVGVEFSEPERNLGQWLIEA